MQFTIQRMRAMADATREVEVARQFAEALDACDYTRAARFLAAGCRYFRPSADVLIGRDAILASYQGSDARARRNFDTVDYRSETTPDELGVIRLTFFDELGCAGAVHTFRSSQIVYFDEHTMISRIELVEIPGERERLSAFCAANRIEMH
jgi:hypothetical protein